MWMRRSRSGSPPPKRSAALRKSASSVARIAGPTRCFARSRKGKLASPLCRKEMRWTGDIRQQAKLTSRRVSEVRPHALYPCDVDAGSFRRGAKTSGQSAARSDGAARGPITGPPFVLCCLVAGNRGRKREHIKRRAAALEPGLSVRVVSRIDVQVRPVRADDSDVLAAVMHVADRRAGITGAGAEPPQLLAGRAVIGMERAGGAAALEDETGGRRQSRGPVVGRGIRRSRRSHRQPDRWR